MTSCVGKEKRGRIVEEGSYATQEGGAQQNYMQEFHHCQVTTVVHQCKHGGVVQPCPHQIMWCPT
jgi:hypothetical protein